MPSKFQLVFLDIFIIFLEMVLTTIAYETSLSAATSATDTTDTLLYIPRSPDPQSSPSTSSKVQEPKIAPYYALDLQFGTIIKRLRGPAPAATREADRDELLPLPNTVPAELRESLRVLLRARADLRARANPPAPPQARPAESTTRTVPGAMDND